MQKFLFIKVDKKFIKITCTDIIYIEAVKNYMRIITADKNYLLLVNMQHLENVLSKREFCRIHRSYIISLEHTTAFDNDFVYLKHKKIPISRQFRNILQEHVVILTNNIKKRK